MIEHRGSYALPITRKDHHDLRTWRHKAFSALINHTRAGGLDTKALQNHGDCFKITTSRHHHRGDISAHRWQVNLAVGDAAE